MSRVEFLTGDPETPPAQPPPPVEPHLEFDPGPKDVTPHAGSLARRGLDRLGPRSLTSRLVAGVVSLVVLLVLFIGGGTYYSLKVFLADRLDQQLQSIPSQSLTPFTNNARNIPAALTVYAVALDPITGDVLYEPPRGDDDALKGLQLSSGQRQSFVGSVSSAPMTIRTTDGTELRVIVRPGTLRSAAGTTVEDATVVLGLSTQLERETLHRLFLLEVAIGGAAVLVALLATTYGVQFSLRRLRGVTSTAQEVAAELSPEGAGLDRRVHGGDDETEVGQLATSFNTMLAAVETQFAARLESEQRMRQFMADASHELRTPLTSIRGFAELARMQRAAGDTSDDNLDRIESEGTRMSRLVEDLLLLARGDADGSDRPARSELIDVADLVDDCVQGSRAAFPDRPIEMDVAGAAQLVGDRDQLVRVVRNLINNAAVHTRPGLPIAVRAWGDGSAVTIQIIDSGPGLAPEDAAHVFERFWRADKARTRARGGSGLGLSIVATIVRTHGGTVRFDSSVEAGSTVTVVLPQAEAA